MRVVTVASGSQVQSVTVDQLKQGKDIDEKNEYLFKSQSAA